jgi:hypothetical protein
MAITPRAVGTWAASNATTQTVTLPTHATGDMLIVRTIRKPFTNPDDTVISTTGWNPVATGVANGATANGVGVGSMGFKAFYKIAASASETNPVVTWGTTAAPGAAVAVSYQKGGSESWVTPVGNGGGDATARTSQTSTIASHISVTAGDLVDFFRGQCDDSGALTVPTITQASVTYDTVVEYPATALLDGTSNDIAADGGYRIATAGTSSAAAVVTGTSAASEQHGAWMTRLRVQASTNFPVTAADSIGSLSDSVDRGAMATLRTTGDSLATITDSISRAAMAVTRSVSETLGSITEAVLGSKVLNRTVRDGIGSYSAEVLADAPSAYYRMGEPSGPVVDTMGGLSGAVSGTVTRDVAGALVGEDDGAIDFDGSTGGVVVPHQSQLNLGNGPFTLEAWLDPDAMNVGQVYTFISKMSVAYGSYQLALFNGYIITVKTGTAIGTTSSVVLTHTGGQYHVVWTHEPGVDHLYVNGVEDLATTGSPLIFIDTASDLNIGYEGPDGEYWDGMIDEVAIYPTVLSADRIAAHYAARESITETASRLSTFARSTVDSLSSITETATRAAMATVRTSADSLSSLTESPSRIVSRIRTAADSLPTLTEAATRILSTVRTAADSVSSITEAVVREVTTGAQEFVRTAADSLSSVTETVARAAEAKARTAVDSLATLTEAVTRAAEAKARTVADSLSSITETPARLGTFIRSAPQTLGAVTETVGSIKVQIRTAVDAVSSVTETASRAAMAKVRTAGDSLSTLTDSVARGAMAVARSVPQALGSITEAVTRGAMAVARSAPDSIATLTETATRGAMAKVRSAADSVSSITELVASLKVQLRTAVDSVGSITETTARALVLARSAGASLATITESVTRIANKTRTSADSLSSITETTARAAMAKLRTATDSVATITETATRAAMAKIRTAADSIGSITESVVRDIITGSQQFARTAADSISSIAETATRSLVMSRSVTDLVAAVTDAVARTTTVARSVADSVPSITEVVAKATGYARTASDVVVSITEAVARGAATFGRQAEDAVGVIGDAVTRGIGVARSVLDSIGSITDSVIANKFLGVVGRARGAIARQARSLAAVVRRPRSSSTITREDKTSGGIERE